MEDITDIFCGFFGMVIPQSGITFYNEVSGEINKYMNIYCQKEKQNSRQFKLKRLHKQILCIGETSFEIPEKYESDEEVYQSVNDFIGMIKIMISYQGWNTWPRM